MKHTCITGEKQNVRIGLKNCVMSLVGAFCCFLQNGAATQFLKSSRLSLIEPNEGWTFQWRKDLHVLQNFLCVVVSTGLILGSFWLKSYIWLNVSIFERTHTQKNKSTVGREEMTDLIFFPWLYLKFRNKPEKDYLDLPGQKTHPKLYLIFSIWKFFEVFFWKIPPCAVRVRSVDSSWHLSMDWYVNFLCCKH